MSGCNTWPEKSELAATVQQMLQTVRVGMFALARETAEEVCIFDKTGVRYTISQPINERLANRLAALSPVRLSDVLAVF